MMNAINTNNIIRKTVREAINEAVDKSIYSDNFKKWFGDWENDPQNASKVVDSNGVPLPVYHGTVMKGKDGLPFKTFRTESDAGEGVMFADNYSVASFFSGHGEARFGNFEEKFEQWPYKNTMEGLVDFLNNVLKNGIYKISHNEGEYNGRHYEFYRLDCEYNGGTTSSAPLGDTLEEAYQKLLYEVQKEVKYMERDSKYAYTGGVYKVYLNIKKPYIFDAQGSSFHMLKTEFHQKRMTVFDLVYFVKQTGQYDGVIVKNVRETTMGNGILTTDYIVFNSNQIKHALDNNGNYSNEMNDITETIIREAVRKTLSEWINEVRYIDTRSEKYNGKINKKHWTDIYNQEPITDDSRIRVFHGCELKTACEIAINGTSGKEYHGRQYSYEAGMNPLGIFVTTDFETAKKFGVSNRGMAIIEFTAKGSDLESPVWNGQGSYFGQGSNPMPFDNAEQRNAQKMQYRQDALNTKDDYYYDGNKRRDISMSHVRNSDKPEMADRLFNNSEHQALFMGDLNPNMIKRIWVNLPREDGYVHTTDSYQPMSVRQFLKQFKDKEWQDGYDYKGQPIYTKIRKQKLFNPNDDVKSFDDLVDAVMNQDRNFFKSREQVIKNLNNIGLTDKEPSKWAIDSISHMLWPKQIIQLYGQDFFNKYFNRLGQ